MADVAVFAVAIFYAGLGAVCLAQPRRVPAQFGADANPPAAYRNEIRAIYGGFPLALAAVLAWAATGASADVREGVLVAAAVSTAGMALGRLVSAVIDPAESRAPWLWFGVEVVLVALLVAAI
jgi:hypothetical protein